MASVDQAGPSNKLDTLEPIVDVQSINKLFPKIDNMEHFPLKVLMNIFKYLDYMDLYNLAENSCLFEGIANIILNERYTHEYLTFYDVSFNHKQYIDFFQRFGNEIKSFRADYITMKDETHWITSVLDKAKNLEKLELIQYSIETDEHLLQRHVNEGITHLTLHNRSMQSVDFVLTKFHNLMKLDIENNYNCNHSFCPSSNPFNILEEVVSNNPALESLVLGEKIKHHAHDIRLYPFDRVMKLIGTHSNQLREFAYVFPKNHSDMTGFRQLYRQPGHIVDSFVTALRHLESLALTKLINSFIDFNELLVRLNSQCSSIKNLKLSELDEQDGDLLEVVELFERLESLSLSFIYFDCKNEIESLIEHLPYLHHFEIEVLNDDIDWSFVLVLLRKCPSLQTLTVASDAATGELEMFGTTQFFSQFIESIQDRNVEIQIKECDYVVGSVTKDEVIWREKLLHWTGCDLNKNLANIQFLDLAKHQTSSTSDQHVQQQRKPFDLILDYLDLKSLYSLFNTSEKCSQLVASYMKQHSQQHGTFTITNEFEDTQNDNYNGLEAFAQYVTNLRVNVVHECVDSLQELFKRFHNLKTLYVHLGYDLNICLYKLIVTQVRHFIWYGQVCEELYSSLYELSCLCPDLETIEMNQPYPLCDKREKRDLKFRKLKKITLPLCSTAVEEVENLKTLFKTMNTELCLLKST